MTRPLEPLHPSHPAHIVHHQLCNHILRRVYKASPDDISQTGCICDHPPEEIVRPICLERGGIPCRIDELTYEAISLPTECNSCAESGSSRGSPDGSSESEVAKEKEGRSAVKSAGKGKKKNAKVSPGVNKVGVRSSKRISASHTPATRLAMGFGGLGIQSPSTTSPGSGSSKKSKKGRRKSKEMNEETVEERVWKHLRSGPVSNY
ncbi:hypothetical protein TWF281_004045 [Arthrobotrys megalospora]